MYVGTEQCLLYTRELTNQWPTNDQSITLEGVLDLEVHMQGFCLRFYHEADSHWKYLLGCFCEKSQC